MKDFFRGWRQKVGVVALMMACGFTLAWHYQTELKAFGAFIDSEYATEIAAFKASVGKVSDEKNMPNPFTWQNMRDDLNGMFESSVFYSVGATIDGHHGSRTIKSMQAGDVVSDFTIFSATDFGRYRNLHTLSYCKTDSGKRLLGYAMYFPDAPIYRRGYIVFSQDAIAKQMNARQFKTSNITSLYLPIVFLLTLISAFLLFNKPETSTQKKTAQPIAGEEGATS